MINNGEKNKPLDCYPYMENELKKYDSMQEDVKKLQGDVQAINEVLSTISENLILLNNIVENLTEVAEYSDFFNLADTVLDFISLTQCKAFKVGNAMQVYIRLSLDNPPQTWEGGAVGAFDYTKIPKPINLFGVIDQRFIGQVSSVTGNLNLAPVSREYVTSGRNIQLNGFYVID